MKVRNREIFDIHAEFFKTHAYLSRLPNIRALNAKKQTVTDFSDPLDRPITFVSRYLKSHGDRNIVTTSKNGKKAVYSLVNSLTYPRLPGARDMSRKVIVDLNKRKGKAIDSIRASWMPEFGII